MENAVHQQSAPRAPQKAPKSAPAVQSPKLATPLQKSRITAYLHGQGVSNEDMAKVLQDSYGVANPKDMTYDQAENIINLIEAKLVGADKGE